MVGVKVTWEKCLQAMALLLLLAAGPAVAQEASPADPVMPRSDMFSPVEGQRKAFSIIAAATLGDSGERITSGLVWRIFENVGDNVSPALVTKSADAAPQFRLAPGNYVIQAAYGYASTSKRIVVKDRALTETLEINAGALKLAGTVGGVLIPSSQISFSVYVAIGADSEGKLVLSNGKPGEIIRLPAGTYHIVSTFGDANAIQRADLRVETGQLTEATLNHRAAVVTLKLVATPGSEAFADTAFSVLTPGGDVVREAIGAFPQVALAEGAYILVARHDNKVYSSEFKVEAGLNRDIEVVESRDRSENAAP